jgi:hypothetical protein
MLEQISSIVHVFNDVPHIIAIDLDEDRYEFPKPIGDLPEPRKRE